MTVSTRSLILMAALILCTAPSRAAILTSGGVPDPTWNSNAMQVWLKADAGVKNAGGTAALDGEAVATWEDQSTYNQDATQTTSTSRPAFVAGLSAAQGNPTISFNGSTFLRAGSAYEDVFQGDFTIFGVIIPDDGQRDDSNNDLWFGSQDRASSPQNRIFNTHVGTAVNPGSVDFLYKTNNVQEYAEPQAAVFSDGPQTAATILTLHADADANGPGGLKVFSSGVEQAPYVTGNDGNTSGMDFSSYSNTKPLFFGAGNNGANTALLPFQGDIAEVLIYKGELTDTDRDAIEGYLMAKYIVPEPSSLVLFGGGLLSWALMGLAGVRRRR